MTHTKVIIELAYLLWNTAIKVNSADPGYIAADLKAHGGTQSVREGAAEAVRLTLIAENGPTGTFSDSKGGGIS